MTTPAEARLRATAFVIAGGLFAGLVPFLLTGTYRTQVLGGPGIQVVSSAGFDPWTGLPYGAVIGYKETPFSPVVAPRTGEIPSELRDRRAIPFPVGFAVGAATTAVAIAVAIAVLTAGARYRRAQATT